jgi:hypothetical protein
MKLTTTNLMAGIITLITTIALTYAIYHYYVVIKGNNSQLIKEGFATATAKPITGSLTSAAEDIQRSNFAIQKCSALMNKSPEIGDREYNIMNGVINGYRLNEWKPVPNAEDARIKDNRQYCFMYNDRSNNIQDFNMHANNSACAKSNPMFKDSSIITNVFPDSQIDLNHIMPLNKCILEIDTNKATTDEINELWRSWSESHCVNISKSLRQKLEDEQANLKLAQDNYEVLKTKDVKIGYNRNIVDSNLAMCGQCNYAWSNAYTGKFESLLQTQTVLKNTQLHSGWAHASNQSLIDMNRAVVENEKRFNTLYFAESNANKVCQSNLEVCHGERDFALFTYDESSRVNRSLNNTNRQLESTLAGLEKNYSDLSAGNVRCDIEKVRMTTNRDEKLRDLMDIKDKYNVCSFDRSNNIFNYNEAETRLNVIRSCNVECRNDRGNKENEYNNLTNDIYKCTSCNAMLSFELSALWRNIAVEMKIKEQAEEDHRTMMRKHEQCILSGARNVQTMSNLRVANVQLYNEMERANLLSKQTGNDVMKDLNNAINNASQQALSTVLEATESKSQNLCKLRTDKYNELAVVESQLAGMDAKKKAAENDCSTCQVTLPICINKHRKHSQLCNPVPGWKLELWKDDNKRSDYASVSSTDRSWAKGSVYRKGLDYFINGTPFGSSSYVLTSTNGGQYEVQFVDDKNPEGSKIAFTGGTGENTRLGNVNVGSYRINKKN